MKIDQSRDIPPLFTFSIWQRSNIVIAIIIYTLEVCFIKNITVSHSLMLMHLLSPLLLFFCFIITDKIWIPYIEGDRGWRGPIAIHLKLMVGWSLMFWHQLHLCLKLLYLHAQQQWWEVTIIGRNRRCSRITNGVYGVCFVEEFYRKLSFDTTPSSSSESSVGTGNVTEPALTNFHRNCMYNYYTKRKVHSHNIPKEVLNFLFFNCLH